MADRPSSPTSATVSQPQPPPSEVKFARSVFDKLGETLDNFKSHALPLLSLYEQWKNLQSDLAMAEVSMEVRGKELVSKAREIVEIESRLSGLKVKLEEMRVEERDLSEREKKVEVREKSVRECVEAIEAKNREIDERRNELGLREKEFDERFRVLEFNEKEINGALEVREKEIEKLGEALEAKKRVIVEECRVLEDRKRGIEEECRCLEAKEKEIREKCRWLGLREKKIKEDVKELESRRRRIGEEFDELEERERVIVERNRDLEEREREVEDKRRDQEVRGREMRELGELLESKAKEIVEGTRVLEDRKKGMDASSRGLGFGEKELDERGKELELREKKIREHENALELREKGFDERGKELESREKRIREHENALELREKELDEARGKLQLKENEVDKGFRTACEELRLKKEQLVESRRALGLKEREIKEQNRDLELKQERMNEQCKALELKKKEISASLKLLESKEGQICGSCKALAVVEKEGDGAGTVEMRTGQLKDSKTDDGHLSVKVKEEQAEEIFTGLDSTVKQVDDCCNVPNLEEQKICENGNAVKLRKEINQNGEVANLKARLMERCSTLFKQANEILKLQDGDCCNVPDIREREISDSCTSTEKQVIQGCDRVDSGEKQANKGPQAEKQALRNTLSKELLSDINLLIRNEDARGITSYITENAKKDDMWHEKMLGLREEIPGLIQSLITEKKHVQAAICLCVLKVEDVFAPDLLLKSHLEYIQQRVEEIVKEGSATGQDEAANMELSALRDVLKCISEFKLESKYSPAPLQLRITQLEKEMEERRTPTHSLMEKKRDQNLEKKAERLESAPGNTNIPKLSVAHSDSHHEKKRKASSSPLSKQNKHSDSHQEKKRKESSSPSSKQYKHSDSHLERKRKESSIPSPKQNKHSDPRHEKKGNAPSPSSSKQNKHSDSRHEKKGNASSPPSSKQNKHSDSRHEKKGNESSQPSSKQNMHSDSRHEKKGNVSSQPSSKQNIYSDSRHEKKGNVSSPPSPKQLKPSRSNSRENRSPPCRRSPHGHGADVLPYRNHVARPAVMSPSWPAHHFRPPGAPAYHLPPRGAMYGVPYDMGTGRYGVAGLYPVGYHTPASHFRAQGERTERSRDFVVVNPSVWRR